MEYEKVDFFKINLKEMKKHDNLIYNYETPISNMGFDRVFKSVNLYNNLDQKISCKSNIPNLSLFTFTERVKEEPKQEEVKREEKKIDKEKSFNINQNNLKPTSDNLLKEAKPSIFSSVTAKSELLSGGLFSQAIKSEQVKTEQKFLFDKKVEPTVPKAEDKKIEIKQPEKKIEPKQPENKIEPKLENNLKPIQAPQVKTEIVESKYKKQLLEASNQYWNKLRVKINSISEDKSRKSILDKIVTEINIVLQQFSSEADVDRSVKKINSILKEIISEYDYYLYLVDYLIKCLLIKSEKYLSEDKKNFRVFAKLISELGKNNVMIRNYFLHMITYKCPYLIPKIFTDKEYPDEKVRRKRLGFSDTSSENERFVDFLNNMECYSYLYFNYLLHLNQTELIKDYFTNLQIVNITHPVASVFKVFLYILGTKIRELVGMQKLTEVYTRFIKTLEDLKNKTTQGDIKSVLSANIRMMKKYHINLKENKNIDS